MNSIFLLFISFTLISHSMQSDEQIKDISLATNVQDSVPQYSVRFFNKLNIVIDGNLRENDWKNCNIITPLSSPWEKGVKDSTFFRACYDNNFFYFSFEVHDQTITCQKQINEKSVAKGDRVEMFFSANSSMSTYYCLEISPEANLLDYQASYHRVFNRDWNIEGASIKAKKLANIYYVEGKIPLLFFKRMINRTTIKGATIRAGIFRADKKNLLPNDDFTWFSWVNLNTENPDFHIPAALGYFKF